MCWKSDSPDGDIEVPRIFDEGINLQQATDVFDEYAGEYDKWYHAKPGSSIYESELRAIKALASSGLGAEVGVGTGVFAARLGITIGVDPALKAIKLAKRRGIEVVRGVTERLPIKSECLDYVTSILTLCFLRDPEAYLSEAWRVVKHGGRLFYMFHSTRQRLG